MGEPAWNELAYWNTPERAARFTAHEDRMVFIIAILVVAVVALLGLWLAERRRHGATKTSALLPSILDVLEAVAHVRVLVNDVRRYLPEPMRHRMEAAEEIMSAVDRFRQAHRGEVPVAESPPAPAPVVAEEDSGAPVCEAPAAPAELVQSVQPATTQES